MWWCFQKPSVAAFRFSVVVYHESLDRWQPGAHAGTFRGNQLAMAAGTATLQFVKENRLDLHAAAMGDRLMQHLHLIQKEFSCLGDVRGRGLMNGVEIVDSQTDADRLGARPPCQELARRIQKSCLDHGLIVELGGRQGSVVRFLPPLIVTAEDIDRIAGIFKKALSAALAVTY